MVALVAVPLPLLTHIASDARAQLYQPTQVEERSRMRLARRLYNTHDAR